MLKRLKKLILIGVISVTTLLSNTVIFASDNTAEVETQQTETVESETPGISFSSSTTKIFSFIAYTPFVLV